MSPGLRRLVLAAAALAVPVLAVLGWRLTRGSNPLGVTSIVLITLDGVRADALGCYGVEPSPTPVLDRLAAEGVRFARCLSTSPSTLPAHASLLSGTDPVAHGCRVDGAFAFAPDNPSLAAALGQHGFLTRAFVSHPALGRASGLDLGFEEYDDRSCREDGRPSPEARGRPGEYTVDAALEFVELAGFAPFFLWVHLDDGHGAHHPPAGPPALAERIYANNLQRVDRNVERLLAGLRRAGRLDGALVAITGAHGEGLGEHGEWGHSLLLFDSTLRVPLIIWSPGRLPAGRSVEEPISLISVAPTLLDLLDLKRPPAMYGTSRAFALGEEPGASPQESGEPIYFETVAPRTQYGFADLRGVELGGRKLVVGPARQLFRPRDDPGERFDLISREPQAAEELEAALGALLARRRTGRGAPATLPARTRGKLMELGLLEPVEPLDRAPRSPRAGLGIVEAIRQASVLAEQDRGAAETLLSDLLTAEPEVPEVHRLMGRLYRSAGDHQAAAASFARVIELAPGVPDGYVDLGRELAASERSEEAEACLLAALELDPSDLQARLWLGRLYFDAGRFELARVRYDQVLAVSPGLAAACLGRAGCLLEMNNVRLADEDLRTALETDPENLEVLALLVRTCLLLANQEDALKFFQRALLLGAGWPWPEELDRPERD